jgi:hypothetical protein
MRSCSLVKAAYLIFGLIFGGTAKPLTTGPLLSMQIISQVITHRNQPLMYFHINQRQQNNAN